MSSNKVYVDGELVTDEVATSPVLLKVEGDIFHIIADGSVRVKGVVAGSIDAGGSVYCENVASTVTAGGSVKCHNVKGSIKAGGSVTYTGKGE